MSNALLIMFRDSITPPGEAIRGHAQIADVYRRVYFGWVAELGEEVPAQILLEADRMAASEGNAGIEILMCDSGQVTLYSAKCLSIAVLSGGGRFSTPRPDLTPAYMRRAQCAAWFELGAIIKLVDFEYELGSWEDVECLSRRNLTAARQESGTINITSLTHSTGTIWQVFYRNDKELISTQN